MEFFCSHQLFPVLKNQKPKKNQTMIGLVHSQGVKKYIANFGSVACYCKNDFCLSYVPTTSNNLYNTGVFLSYKEILDLQNVALNNTFF